MQNQRPYHRVPPRECTPGSRQPPCLFLSQLLAKTLPLPSTPIKVTLFPARCSQTSEIGLKLIPRPIVWRMRSFPRNQVFVHSWSFRQVFANQGALEFGSCLLE